MIELKKDLRQSGFTLVELTVVIVVIAILAAIGYVSYVGMHHRAREAVVASDFSLASEVLNTDRVREGDFPDNLSDADRGSGVPASTDTLYYYIHDNATIPSTFCVTGANGSAFMYVTESTVPQNGTCPEHAYLLIEDEDDENNPGQTVFVFDTAANGCSGTVQLPVALPTSGGTIDWGDGTTRICRAHFRRTPIALPVPIPSPMTARLIARRISLQSIP